MSRVSYVVVVIVEEMICAFCLTCAFPFSAALLVRRFKCLRALLFAALFVGSGVRERKQGERLRGPENVVAGNMEELHFSFEVCFF